MNAADRIHHAIPAFSKKILTHASSMRMELGSAKNYVCTPDLKHWTYGKSVVLVNGDIINGARARKKLEDIGFIDILKHGTARQRKIVIAAFENWASKVKNYPLLEKFREDQAGSKRFMLLVHNSSTVVFGTAKKTKVVTDDNQKSFDEGFKRQIVREVAHRNSKVVQQAKATHGVTCEVCEFNFEDTYGSHGAGFIEMHHLKPIARGERKTNADDLRPVCANCHRMLHRGERMLSIEELRGMILEFRPNHRKSTKA